MFWSYLIFSLKKENDNYVGHCLQFLRVWAKILLNDIELRLFRLTVNESWWHVNTNAYKMPKKNFWESLLMTDIIYFRNPFHDLMKQSWMSSLF